MILVFFLFQLTLCGQTSGQNLKVISTSSSLTCQSLLTVGGTNVTSTVANWSVSTQGRSKSSYSTKYCAKGPSVPSLGGQIAWKVGVII